MNETITFEIVYDIQDKKGTFRRYRKTFLSAPRARAHYDMLINTPHVIDAFCTARISSFADDLSERVTLRRIAQYYRK